MDFRILRLVAPILTSFAVGAPALALSTREARALYAEGLRELKEQQFEAALNSFSDAAENGEFLLARYGIARVYQAAFNLTMLYYAESDEAYTELIAELERLPAAEWSRELMETYLDAGLLYLKGADYPRARIALERFVTLAADSMRISEAQNALGIAYYYLDRYDQAVNSFELALEADIANSEARFNLRSVYTRVEAFSAAMALYRSGLTEQAFRQLERLRDIAPRYLPGRRLEANILQAMDRHDEAVQVLNEILGFEPDSLDSYRLRIDMAKSLIALQRSREACRTLMENLVKFPDVPDLIARTEGLFLLNQLGGACKGP